jgi:hypothetical protein
MAAEETTLVVALSNGTSDVGDVDGCEWDNVFGVALPPQLDPHDYHQTMIPDGLMIEEVFNSGMAQDPLDWCPGIALLTMDETLWATMTGRCSTWASGRPSWTARSSTCSSTSISRKIRILTAVPPSLE